MSAFDKGQWAYRAIAWPACGWAGYTGNWWIVAVCIAFALGAMYQIVLDYLDRRAEY